MQKLQRLAGIALAFTTALAASTAEAAFVWNFSSTGQSVSTSTKFNATFSGKTVSATVTGYADTGATVTAGGTEAAGAAQAGGSTSEIVVPLKGPLAPGRYEVKWHAVSADTHKSQGVFSFEVKP